MAPLVLLLNYNADERTTYRVALEGAGFEVVIAANPADALALAVARPPAAVVTRVLQPGWEFDGVELTRRLKNDPRTAGVPVVITSSLLEAHQAKAAKAAGCDAYLLLPGVPEDVASAVVRAIAVRSVRAAS
jgi:CheY-like chemotaxis protein